MRRSTWGTRVAAAIVAAIVLAACGGGGDDDGDDDDQAAPQTTAGTVDAVQAAIAARDRAFEGTNGAIDATARPAADGKHVVVISTGQGSISSQIPSDAAVEAAKAIGWDVDLYDAQLNPSNYAPLVRQAIAAGADGIVLDAIDCQTVQQPLKEAQAKGIVVIPIYAFDCNDPHAGGAAEGLFTDIINYGEELANIPAFTEKYGADQASYIIAASDNAAKILAIQDPEFTVLYYTLEGFRKTIEASGGAEIASTLEVTVSDLTTGKLVPKIQAELLRHPEVTWIKAPYTYITTLGIIPALGANPNKIKVMGGEGFLPELDLLRQGKIDAVNIVSSAWTAWAAIDSMNSVFRGEKPVYSGLGWQIADADHNVPPSGDFVPDVDFRAAYKQAWGVG